MSTTDTPSPYKLANQVIVLTGASSGIGAAIAKTLFASGASLVLGARRLSQLEQVAEACRTAHPDAPGTIVCQACDVTARQDVQALVERAPGGGASKVDVLINCAGVMFFTNMKNAVQDQWDQTLDVNCKGVMNGFGAVLPAMVKAGRGKILTISSDAGMRQFQTLAVYCASKTFVETLSEITRYVILVERQCVVCYVCHVVSNTLTHTLTHSFHTHTNNSRELVGTGVTITTICPGDVKGTELIMKNTDQEAAEKSGITIGAPVGEGFTREQLLDVQDVADAVLYALTAPPHVAINTVLIEPRDQE